jgi:hypothetical protein
MSDFAIYKSLKTSELTNNAQFSTTGTGPSTTVTGASNAITQACTREQKGWKIANLAATTTEATVAEALQVPFTQNLKSIAIVPVSGAAVANVTDYSTVNVYKRLAGNQAAVLMGSINLTNVALTQWLSTPGVLVANSANYAVAPGDVVTANVVLTGNGTANTLVGILQLTFEDV